uniref:Uncharacterized protein n=1 Tax=Vitis vinifera TaxID=29760 RepID=F6HTX6_VITVI
MKESEVNESQAISQTSKGL